MAQAQFVGPSSAEISQNSLNSLMQGLERLQRFREFTTEQARLNKIEEIKNKATSIDLLIKHYGGIKELIDADPGVVGDFFSRVGFSPDQIQMTLQTIRNDAPSQEELMRLIGGYAANELGGSEGGQGGQGEKPPEGVKTSEVVEKGGTGGVTPPGKARPANLFAYDQARTGAYGEPVKAAVLDNDALDQKYKGLGWGAVEQGTGGESAPVYFTPAIAQKVLAGMEPTIKKPSKPSGITTQAWSAILQNNSEPDLIKRFGASEEPNPLYQQIQADIQRASKNWTLIDQARRKATAGQEQLYNAQGNPVSMTEEQKAAAGTNQNRLGGKPVFVNPTQPGQVPTPGGQGGQTTSASTQSTPSNPNAGISRSSAGQSLMQKINEVSVKVFSEGQTPKDTRLLQSITATLKTNNTYELKKLSMENPALAKEIVRQKVKDENWTSFLALTADPNREREFSKDLESGKYDANIKYLSDMATAAVLNAKTLSETAPAEIRARLEEAAARIEDARSRVLTNKSQETIAGLQIEEARFSLLRAQAMARSQDYAPVKDLINAYTQSVKAVQTQWLKMTDPKTGKISTDPGAVSALNALVDSSNAMRETANLQVQDYTSQNGIPYNEVGKDIPQFKAITRNWWQKFWNVGPQEGLFAVEETSEPPKGGGWNSEVNKPAAANEKVKVKNSADSEADTFYPGD